MKSLEATDLKEKPAPPTPEEASSIYWFTFVPVVISEKYYVYTKTQDSDYDKIPFKMI